MKNIVSEWDGKNKDQLVQELDLVKVMTQSPIIEWFFNKVQPRFSRIIAKEESITDIL